MFRNRVFLRIIYTVWFQFMNSPNKIHHQFRERCQIIIGKTKSAILKNEKYIFLVFSDLFGRGCLTAVQSPLKRYLIG